MENIQCLQFYQSEGADLALPNWNHNITARLIAKKVSEMKRSMRERRNSEERSGCILYEDELASLLKHVCCKCGAMGPVLEDAACNMTFYGVNQDGINLWLCAECCMNSPPYQEFRRKLSEKTESLKWFSGSELSIAFIGQSERVTFTLPNTNVQSNPAPDTFYVSLGTKILVPSEAIALKEALTLCNQAFDQKEELKHYMQDISRRPLIVDIPGILSGLYRNTLADLKTVMNRLLIGLSNVAKGEILSVNPNITNAIKTTSNIGMTLPGALRDVCSWSIPAEEQRSMESAARANVQGRVKTYIECTILKNIEDKELQRIVLTASQAFGPLLDRIEDAEPIFILRMGPIIVKYIDAKVKLLVQCLQKGLQLATWCAFCPLVGQNIM